MSKEENLSATDLTLYQRYRDDMIRAADRYRKEQTIFTDKTNLTMSIRDVQNFLILLQRNEFAWTDLDGQLKRAIETLGYQEYFGGEAMNEGNEGDKTLIGLAEPEPEPEKRKSPGFLERFFPRRK